MTSSRYLVVGILLCALQACTSLPEQNTPAAPAPQPTSDNQVKPNHDTQALPAKTPISSDDDELWPYLTARFELLTDQADTDNVTQFISKYASTPRTLQRMLQNAQPYLAYVTEQLEKRDMPLELALLPMIESHYRAGAYSPRHAAGLWQFIPSTGKRYGLKQNWWYDGRRDVTASTGAALDYLQDLYHKMDGDWLKALAAYNCGEGRVQKAEQENLRANKPTDFWSLDLPRETEEYVPRLLALASLFQKADSYAIEFPNVHKTNRLQLVETQSQIELGRAAELAGLSVQELRLLNPGYLRNATDPEGPHHLLLPADKASLFSRNNARLNLAQRMPLSQSKQNLATHRIRKGETLWDIARRYDTTIKALCQANHINKRSTLVAGDKLLIPTGAAGTPTESPTVVAAVAKKSPPKAANRQHSIRKGETLWDIARNYKTTITALCAANNISKRSTLNVGDKLKIPAASSTADSRTVVAKNITPPADRWHQIRKGETLWDIARRYDTSVNVLRSMNNLPHRTTLQVGYKLRVPSKPRSQNT